MDLQTLANKCHEDTLAYLRGISAPTANCFELMRLALKEEANHALTLVHNIYYEMLRSWVYKHSGYKSTGEEVDYFINGAFSKFYFAVRKEKFDKFERLSSVLQYLKACVHTTIAEYVRRQRLVVVPLRENKEIPIEPDYERSLRSAEIWERMCTILPDEEDQHLARLLFFQHRKPANISASFANTYPDARSVTVAKQRLLRALRRDAVLRDLLGVSEEV